MIDNKKNIEIVVNCLKRHGIRHVVISPGGTNITFVKAVQDDTYFRCYSVVDERSAMYFAIGIYLQTGEFVATSCTSAQATRNYLPGLTEAFYKNVPILAITMSKHPRFTYQEYMQAPDQCSLPKDCVKASYSLPVISEKDDILHSIRVANEAILELSHHGTGPVQLCIPWLDFPLGEFKPQERTVLRYEVGHEWNISLRDKKVLLVVGERRRLKNEEKEAIELFCENCNCAVYVNHLSNFRGKYSFEGNLLFSTISRGDFKKDLKPDVIISIGGQTGDYPLYGILSELDLGDTEHWRVSRDGNVIDTYDKLTKIFECSEKYFFSKFSSTDEVKHTYYETIMSCSQFDRNIEIPFSNAYAARSLTRIIPHNSNVQFSILNSLRNWNLFEFKNEVKCFSNVGAFGIDGGMSTLIGQSMVSDDLCFMIIGDLAFLYDINSLSIRGLKNNIRILLVNNDGGVEFKLGIVDNKSIDKYIAAGGHFKNAKGWAETCGFRYICAKSKKEFDDLKEEFVVDGEQPILFELFVSDVNDATAYSKLIKANKDTSTADALKDGIKLSVKKFLVKGR